MWPYFLLNRIWDFATILSKTQSLLIPGIDYFAAVVIQSRVVSDSLWLYGLQHTRLPCSSLFPQVRSNSCSLSQWCYLTISSYATHFPFSLQSLAASGSFQMSRLFSSDGQSIGVSASVLPMNIQGWFPLWLTHLISLQSKRLSRVFPNTTIWKHQSFGDQSSLWSNSHICIWLLEKLQLWLDTS